MRSLRSCNFPEQEGLVNCICNGGHYMKGELCVGVHYMEVGLCGGVHYMEVRLWEEMYTVDYSFLYGSCCYIIALSH